MVCFHLGTVMNKVAVNLLDHVIGWACAFISVRPVPRKIIARVGGCFALEDTVK